MTEEAHKIPTAKRYYLEHKDTIIKRATAYTRWKRENKPEEHKALKQIYNRNYAEKQKALRAANPEKRPLGRPRKKKPQEEQSSDATATEIIPVPKTRGRPSKYDIAEVVKAYIPRTKGRPKKEKTQVGLWIPKYIIRESYGVRCYLKDTP